MKRPQALSVGIAVVLGLSLVLSVQGGINLDYNVRVEKHEECHVNSRDYFSWLLDVLPPKSTVNGREFGHQSGYPFSPRVGAEYMDRFGVGAGRDAASLFQFPGASDRTDGGQEEVQYSLDESASEYGVYSRYAWDEPVSDLRPLQRFARGIKHNPVTFPWLDGPIGQAVMSEVFPDASKSCDYMPESYTWGICGNLYNYTLNWHGDDVSAGGRFFDELTQGERGYTNGLGGNSAHEYRFLEGTREKMGAIEAHIEELLLSLNETVKFKWDRKAQAEADEERAEAYLQWREGGGNRVGGDVDDIVESEETGSVSAGPGFLQFLFEGNNGAQEDEGVVDAKCFEALRDYLCGVYIRPCMNCRDRTAPRKANAANSPDPPFPGATGVPTFYFETVQEVAAMHPEDRPSSFMEAPDNGGGADWDPDARQMSPRRMGPAGGLGPRYTDHPAFFDSCSSLDFGTGGCDPYFQEYQDQQFFNVTPGQVWTPGGSFLQNDWLPNPLNGPFQDWQNVPGSTTRFVPQLPQIIEDWYAVTMIPPCLDICNNAEATCGERLPSGFLQCAPPISSSKAADRTENAEWATAEGPSKAAPSRNENMHELDRALHTPWYDLDYVSIGKYEQGYWYDRTETASEKLTAVQTEYANVFRFGPQCQTYINRDMFSLQQGTNDPGWVAGDDPEAPLDNVEGRLRYPDPVAAAFGGSAGVLQEWNTEDRAATPYRFEYVPSMNPCRAGWVEALGRELYQPMRVNNTAGGLGSFSGQDSLAYPNARHNTHLVCVGSNPALHSGAVSLGPVAVLLAAVIAVVVGVQLQEQQW